MNLFEQSGALTSFGIGCSMSLMVRVPEGKSTEVGWIQAVRWEPKGKGSQGSLVLERVFDDSLIDDNTLFRIRMSILSIEDMQEIITVAYIDDVVLESDITTGEVIRFTGSKLK